MPEVDAEHMMWLDAEDEGCERQALAFSRVEQSLLDQEIVVGVTAKPTGLQLPIQTEPGMGSFGAPEGWR